jgi:hypothetical protein
MNDIWVKNKEANEMIYLKDCISCYTYVDDDNEHDHTYRIYFSYIKDELYLDFDSKVEMQNFYDHLQDTLKPIIINPKQTPLKL